MAKWHGAVKPMGNFQRFLWSLLVLVVALIPTWLYLGIRFLMEPTGFWQEMAVAGCGLVFLGGVQLILLVVAIAAWLAIWTEGR